MTVRRVHGSETHEREAQRRRYRLAREETDAPLTNNPSMYLGNSRLDRSGVQIDLQGLATAISINY